MKKSILFLLTIVAFLFAGCKNYDDDIDGLKTRVTALEAWQKTVNENITSLQGLVSAVQKKDYVTNVVPLASGDGYQITFQNSGTITIKNGTNGTTPVIGVAKYTDGNYYWTVNTGSGATWMKNADGNMIRTTGDNGAAGKDAVAPKVQINTDTGFWEISTDGGTTWTSTGVKVKGDQGDAVFAKNGVTVGNTNVTFTLADGTTTFSLPLYQAMKIASDITDDIIEFSTATPSRVLKLTLPTGLKQSDFTSILAEVKCVNGTSTDIQTRADATDNTWGCKLSMPTYQTDGTCNDDASVTVTKPDTWSPEDSTALLIVTLSMKDGTTLTSSRTLKWEGAIYAVGYRQDESGRYFATLWKNGKAITLPNEKYVNAIACAIAVSGGNVYVAGDENNNGSYYIAKVWKNGTLYQALTEGTNYAQAASIALSGDDIYVAGNEVNGTNNIAKVWKNGKIYQTLGSGTNDTFANSIAVSGSDVYVAGREDNGTNNIAMVWKNGNAIKLTDGTTNNTFANSIAVSGSDVYVAGTEGNGTNNIAKVWKNGNAIALTDGTNYAFASSIAVSGSDVYVVGGEYSGKYIANVWKNGALYQTLSEGMNSSFANSIVVSGSDVYVGGSEYKGTTDVAKIWKNGKVYQVLGDGTQNSSVSEIALVGK